MLQAALDSIRPFIRERLDTGDPTDAVSFFGGEYCSCEEPPAVKSVARLRLDFELSGPTMRGADSDDIAGLCVLFLKSDLEDLIECGDVTSSDPLMIAMDGALRRGQHPVSIDIPSCVFVWQEKPGKDSTEFTVHLMLCVGWS